MTRVTARGRADAALLVPFLAGGRPPARSPSTPARRARPTRSRGASSSTAQGSRFSWPLAWPTEIKDPLLEAELTPGLGLAHARRGAPERRPAPPLRRLVRATAGSSLTATLRRREVPARLRPGGDPLGRADVRRDRRTRGGSRGPSRSTAGSSTGTSTSTARSSRASSRLPRRPGPRASLLDTLALDVGIGTASGVRIRNNVADLSASWSRLDVTGTARRPVVRGRIDVESGGSRLRLRPDVPRSTRGPSPTPGTRRPTRGSISSRPPRSRTARSSRRAASGDVFADARVLPKGGRRAGEVDAAAGAGAGPRGLLRRPPRLHASAQALGPVVALDAAPSSSSARPTRPRASRSRGTSRGTSRSPSPST